MIRDFILAALASFGLWLAGERIGLFAPEPTVDLEAEGPLLIDEYVRVVTPDDLPLLVSGNGDEASLAGLVGQLAIGARRAAWTMDCPLVVGVRGWKDHGNVRPAGNARGIVLPDGATFVLRDVQAGPQTPHLTVPGPPPPGLDYRPPIFVTLIEVPENRPCVDPKTGRTWHGTATVISAAMVAPPRDGKGS
ncbi:MAG: hypothetical protein KDG89_06990 [Geminicoccaceae bacterium]|nr:hypothetical protein [Geminicoccaceae bacterium]